jgi:hypothetical protein
MAKQGKNFIVTAAGEQAALASGRGTGAVNVPVSSKARRARF